jgi:DNA-directed RNA polymerase subunit F
MEVIKEKLVTFPEAKKILESKAKEKELGYEQNNAFEHLKKFSKLSMKKAAEMMKELDKIKKLKDRHKVNIINLLPQDLDDLRILFAHEIITLTEEEKKAILHTVKKFT